MTSPRATDPIRVLLDELMDPSGPWDEDQHWRERGQLADALRGVLDIVDVWADQESRGGAPNAIPVDGLRVLRYVIATALGVLPVEDNQ